MKVRYIGEEVQENYSRRVARAIVVVVVTIPRIRA